MTDFNRRNLLLAAALLPVAGGAAARAAAQTPSPGIPGPTHATSIAGMIIVNALGGLYNPNADIADDAPRELQYRIDERALRDARASGLAAVNVTVGWVFGPGDPFEHSVRDTAQTLAQIRNQPADLIHVVKAADIEQAQRDGKIGLIMGFQNGAMFAGDASRVDIFADMGVRVMQLTYNDRNSLGSGSIRPDTEGLTAFGREVMARIEQNRAMVDLSHSNRQTCLDAIAAAKRPPSINHTGCRALADLPRNKTDEELRGVADKGGFIGIYFMPFLAKNRTATAADAVDHIMHAVQVAGIDHVGIGTDGGITSYDDMAAYMEEVRKDHADRVAKGIAAPGESATSATFLMDMRGPGQFQRLADLLLERGLKMGEVEKILGLNFTRFAREIWG